jgi:glycosyltransferase involved in cell wall biosynthesis
MKAVVLSFYHPDLVNGGGQQVAINLHRALLKKGVESTFVGADNNVPATLRSVATPLSKLAGRKNEYVCQVSSFDSFFMLNEDVWASKALFNLIVQIKPDVIYANHFLMLGVNLLAQIKVALPNAKFIFVAHEFLSICTRDGHIVRPDGTACSSHTPTDCIKCFPTVGTTNFIVRNSIFENFLTVFDRIVTPSKFMHSRLLSVYPNLKGRMTCIPNGSFFQSDIQKLSASKITNNQIKKVGFFGQMLADKGVYELLNAADVIISDMDNVSFDFWGGNLNLNSSEFRAKFEAKLAVVKEKPNGANVRLMGVYKNQDSISLMKNYDVLVFPSKWPETFSLVFSEAVLAGASIVVPDIGAFKERSKAYKDRVFLYNPSEQQGMVDSIRFALTRNIKPISISYPEDLSIESMADLYISLV